MNQKDGLNSIYCLSLSKLLTLVVPVALLVVSGKGQAALLCSDVLSSKNTAHFTSLNENETKSKSKVEFPRRNQFSSEMIKAFEEIKKEWEQELNVETTRRFIEIESVGSFNKAAIFEILGFKWNAGGAGSAPDFYEFATRFHGQMIEYGYKDANYIRPALVFSKKDASVPGGVIFKLVDPLQVGQADVPVGFKRMNRDEESFNLPYSVIMQGLKDGLFPLLGGLHDVSHYVGLLQNKDMAVALVESIGKLPPKRSKHLGRRIIWLMEYFTAMTGQPKSVIKNYLNEELRIMGLPTRTQIRDQLSSLPEQELLRRAFRSAELLDKTIVDFGGAAVAPWEKVYDISRLILNNEHPASQIENYPKIGNGATHLKTLLAYHEEMFLEDKSEARLLSDRELTTRYKNEKRYDTIIRIYPRLFSLMTKDLLAHFSGPKARDVSYSLDIPNFRDMNYVYRKPRATKSANGNIIYDLEVTPEGHRYLKKVLLDLTSAVEFQLAQAVYGLSSTEQVKALLQPRVTQEDPFGSYLQQLYPGFIKESELLDPLEKI